MKKDKYADVRGREINYEQYKDDILAFSITCFVAGIDDNAISLHPIDKDEAISQYAGLWGHSIEEEVKSWVHPYDYVICVRKDKMPLTGIKRYNSLLKILRSDVKSFKLSDIKFGEKGLCGGSTGCPF